LDLVHLLNRFDLYIPFGLSGQLFQLDPLDPFGLLNLSNPFVLWDLCNQWHLCDQLSLSGQFGL
jgi:hypothetical protein